ncbi:hypothetical protein [Brunnivagina elsteri]|uniref:Uncharacterized protein n=1 Tax=Brunnivagina elsteri CCALA 953 TaxID=987040 RepID=A0A2A2TAE8_9CYAN|nr:hypothetical protein [Calothrix elsteri]PAX48236.1 hypothetical protein CK510_28490 [Calothrix elsteri CCALA 953]
MNNSQSPDLKKITELFEVRIQELEKKLREQQKTSSVERREEKRSMRKEAKKQKRILRKNV